MVSEGDHRYRAQTSRPWWGNPGPHGGHLAASMLRAICLEAADAELAPRTFTIHFSSRAEEGDLLVEARIERQGGSLATISSRITQQGRLIALGLAAMARARKGPELVDRRPPEVPGPEAVEGPWGRGPGSAPSAPGSAPSAMDNYDYRFAIGKPFSGGPVTDMLSHPLARMLVSSGLRYPTRVVAGGGLFVEQDGRTVPDLTTLIADFEEGTQLVLSAVTTSAYPQEDLIRGRHGAIKFLKGGFQIHHDDPHGGAGLPARLETTIRPTEFVPVNSPKNDTEALWENFLDCVRRCDANTLAPPELGTATVAITSMALRSLNEGRAFGWDTERREMVPADAAWLAKHSPRSRPGQTEAPDYQKLAGPRTDG